MSKAQQQLNNALQRLKTTPVKMVAIVGVPAVFGMLALAFSGDKPKAPVDPKRVLTALEIDHLITTQSSTEVSMCMSRSFTAMGKGEGRNNKPEVITLGLAAEVEAGCEGVVKWYYTTPLGEGPDALTRECVFKPSRAFFFATVDNQPSPETLTDRYRFAQDVISKCELETQKRLTVTAQQNRIY